MAVLRRKSKNSRGYLLLDMLKKKAKTLGVYIHQRTMLRIFFINDYIPEPRYARKAERLSNSH
jgi:hypothetical protein